MKNLIITVVVSLIFFGCTNSLEHLDLTTQSCGNDGFQGLTLDEFKAGVAKYGHTRANVISQSESARINAVGFQDARSCWYSLDTLKKFICLIEKYSSELNLPPSQLGIRFFYAAYPNNKIMYGQNYGNKHTLFMVPTYNLSNENRDFDPRYSALNKSDSIVGILNLPSTTRLFILDATSTNPISSQDLLKNQGQLCPPTCPSSLTTELNSIDLTNWNF